MSRTICIRDNSQNLIEVIIFLQLKIYYICNPKKRNADESPLIRINSIAFSMLKIKNADVA